MKTQSAVVDVLMAISLMATDVAAQTGTVTGSISCNPNPAGYDFTWSVTWTDPPSSSYDIVGAYMADYRYQSAETKYSPIGSSSDGSETVIDLPQSETFEGQDYHLAGVLVWFEWGEWVQVGGLWYWTSSGSTETL